MVTTAIFSKRYFKMSCLCLFVFSLYEWTDEQGKKLKCSAPIYIDYAMSYIQEILADERVFPTKAGMKKFTKFNREP